MRLPHILNGFGRQQQPKKLSELSPDEIRYEQQVLKSFHDLRDSLKKLSRADRTMVRKAFEFARSAHEGVKRKSGEPYILHPLAVAHIVVQEMGLVDAISVSAALLHDVVEDTEFELEDIERNFGVKTMQIIDGLTKISGSMLEKGDGTQLSAQAENFRKVLLTIADDIRVVLIKLADRLHNMRTLGSMRRDKTLKIASETMFIYAPLAHRLGLYQIKTDLEDLAFQHRQPQKFAEIQTQMKAYKDEAQDYIDNFIRSIERKLRPTGLAFTVKSRFKSPYSIYSKMIRKKLTYEEIYDQYAIRIILETRDGREAADCWAVYSAISEMYRPNPKRLRDWITFPKDNGYESLHTTLLGPEGRWVEVQIRTKRMDGTAEKGVAAHWKYKDNGESLEKPLTDWIAQVRDILANPSHDALEAVQAFKANLQPNDVYVFTPKGETIRLPNEATVLDFAFKIHTDVGYRAIGAKVGNQVVALDHQLRPGDIVEVLTSRKGKPAQDWIRKVRTPRAKDQIKAFLRRERQKFIELGHRLFRLKARTYGIDEEHAYIKELLAFFMLPDLEEFYYALGTRRIAPEKIKEFIALKESGQSVESEYLAAWEEKRRLTHERLEEASGINPDMLILGKDVGIDAYKLAKCCNPLHGDEILAFKTDKGIDIHRTSCPKALRLMSSFGSSIIQAKWADQQSNLKPNITFLTAIKVVGLDKQGMLMDLIRIISQRKKLNIRKVSIESENELFEGLFHFYVPNLEELSLLMKDLKELPNVYKVIRLEHGQEPVLESDS